MASIRLGSKKSEVFRVAKRQGVSVAPVVAADGRELVGYVRIVDLHLDASQTVDSFRELPTVKSTDSHIAALIQMQSNKEELARVTDPDGETVGLLYASELTDPLFRET